MVNGKTGKDRNPCWTGDRKQWRDVVKRVIPEKADLLLTCSEVAPPPGEARLVLRTNNKTTRATIIGAIRRIRNAPVKVYPALTPFEAANKAVVYTFAQKRNMIVADDGDRVFLRTKNGPAPPHPRYIMLSASTKDVLRGLEESSRMLNQYSATKPRVPNSFARGSRVQTGVRTYADVIAVPGAGQGALPRVGHPPGRLHQPTQPRPPPQHHRPSPPTTGQPWQPPPTTQPPPPHLTNTHLPLPTTVHPSTQTTTGPPPPPPQGLTQAEIWFIRGLRAGNGGAVGGGGWAPPGFESTTGASAAAQLA